MLLDMSLYCSRQPDERNGNMPRAPHHHQHGLGREAPTERRQRREPFGQFRGFGPPFGPPGRRGGFGGRARRGNVRAAIIALLAERPMHGYEIIQELEARTQGIWRPSAGSVYPTLQLLEDEGLVVSSERDGKRAFSLTDAGRALHAEREGQAAPWDELLEGVEPGAHQLREAGMQLFAAVGQVFRAGSAPQQKAAAEILAEARRRVYALLAEEPDAR
jgi:DNA-binding PadR family transcriptional regulator